MKRHLFSGLSLLFSFGMGAYASQEKYVSFNDNWLFTLSDSHDYSLTTYNPEGWRQLDLPHDWTIEKPFDKNLEGCTAFTPGGIGWYSKIFKTEISENQKCYIIFDGVYNNADFWINGMRLGNHPYGYAPIWYDLTDFIEPENGINRLSVRVDHSRYADSRWYTGSGIYRNVKMLITDKLHIPYVFKGSYRKANRSRLDSFTGIGDEKALKILAKVRSTFNVPVVTDIHTASEAEMAAEYVDVLQIPAFLCRQTDLLVAAARTGKIVNIKKGQFLSPAAMRFAADKVVEAGNDQVMLTERGTTFGYQDLIVDYRGIPEMQSFGHPVVLDVTHSLQQPNQTSGVTGGMPQLIETVAKAGVAVGVDGLFMETHEDPSKAKSDGANMLKLDLLEDLLIKLVRIRQSL